MSTVKHVNPYREGSNYHTAFGLIQRKQVVTRSELVEFLGKCKDKDGNKLTAGAATATATVLLSPREKNSKKGDCRGNLSSKGEYYFMQPLKKIKGEEKKFRLRWRKSELAKRDYIRPSTIAKEVKQEKHDKQDKKPAKVAEKSKATA
jgi:hypothetical protein